MLLLLFCVVAEVAKAVTENPVAATTTIAILSGAALAKLMRKHKVTNAALAKKLGVEPKVVAKARKNGLETLEQSKLWSDAICPPAETPVTEASPDAPHHLLLPPNLACLSNLCAGDSEVRFAGTQGVRLTKTDDGYRADATNGRILGIVRGKTPANAGQYPKVKSLDSAPNGAVQATIPGDEWNKAFKMIPLPKFTRAKPVLGHLGVVMGDRQTTFATTDILNKTRADEVWNLDGRFPDVDSVVRACLKETPKVSLRLNASLLIELLQVARQFVDPEDSDCTVMIDVYKSDAPISVRSENIQTGQKFGGLVVPLPNKK